ncbi:hypothetical protein [Cellulosimicrobium sp. Marseille-Q4280]|uniref:hypothetical protein n=1 Tax=Cellulosimicrobium sp. Marseille-Q4280 TaxID=2937992 RepID=UPI00203F7985|nr:hypothetical protein [Cellulosimicrobium sp. Marseille-Q4280]
MTYPPAAQPGPPPGPPAPAWGGPPPVAPTPRRAPRGATVLIVAGAVVLVGALVAGVLGVTLFLRAIPTGVVTSGGSPGSAAIASGAVPGEADVTVAGGEPYTVWAVGGPGDAAFAADDVTVTCGGTTVLVSSPAVTGSSGTGTTSAATVAEFTATDDGTCTVSVATSQDADAGSFVVTEGWRFGEFFATVGGTVLLWILAIGGGLLGLGLLLGGIVWRVAARRA